MPILVFFKTKEEPKKLQFIYDLYLSLDGKPINNIRCERLTFHNPPEDFCQKLFKGGATIKDPSAAGPPAAVSPAKKPPTPPQKKSPHVTGAPPTSTQFSALFGAPIIKGQDAKVSQAPPPVEPLPLSPRPAPPRPAFSTSIISQFPV